MRRAFALLFLSLSACAGGAELRLATAGDLAQLADSLAKSHKEGSLSLGAAKAIARATLDRDLDKAAPAVAADVLRTMLPCARDLEATLARRMETMDAAGAEAALLLLETGALDATTWPRGPREADDAWRAVSARSLVLPEDGETRRRLYLDPVPNVRSAAVRASPAADAAEVLALAEVARMDPDREIRSLAVRALGRVPPGLAPLAVEKLHDVWTLGDESLRGSIADTLGTSPLRAAGGGAALAHYMAVGDHRAQCDAAAALVRDDGPWQAAAFSLLEHALGEGTVRDKMQALSVLPSNPPALRERALSAFREASHAPDVDVQVAAWSRLAAESETRSEATIALEALAAPGEKGALRAQFALATLGDRKVQAWLEDDLRGGRPEKSAAVGGLVALGLPSRVAPLLADPDPHARDHAACMILVASHRTGAH